MWEVINSLTCKDWFQYKVVFIITMWTDSGEGSVSIYPWSSWSYEAGYLMDKGGARTRIGGTALCALPERIWVTKGRQCSNLNKQWYALSFILSLLPPSFLSTSSFLPPHPHRVSPDCFSPNSVHLLSVRAIFFHYANQPVMLKVSFKSCLQQ